MKNSRTRDRQSLRHSEISSMKADTGNSAAALLLFTPPQKESEERKKPVCSARTDLQLAKPKAAGGDTGALPGVSPLHPARHKHSLVKRTGNLVLGRCGGH